MQRFLKNWLPVLIWLGVISLGSTDLMSAEHTSRFIVPLLHWLKPDISAETLASIHFIVRKAAHVSEYAIFSLLLLRAAILIPNLNRSVLMLYVSVWIACLFVAASDEFHQTFVPSRGASVGDIIIDGGGTILGLLIGAMVVMSCSLRGETASADA